MIAVGTDESRALARQELEQRDCFDDLRLYIPAANPAHVVREKLAPLYVELDRMRAGEPVHLLLAAPPRSYKSTTVFHAAVRELLADPKKSFGYGTYNLQFAREQSSTCRTMAARAGLWVSDEKVQDDPAARFDLAKSTVYWQTRARGGAKFVGRGGSAIGSGFDFVFIDDPVKSGEEAENDAAMDRAWTWMTGTMFTRANPGASLVVGHHRWSERDPIGRLLAQDAEGFGELSPEARDLMEGARWKYLEFPAVGGKGDPAVDELLMEGGWFNRQELVFMKATNPGVWAGKYQQKPERSGEKMFPTAYATWEPALDRDGERLGLVVNGEWFPVPDLTGKVLVLAFDTAGTASSSADYTAGCLLACSWPYVEEWGRRALTADVLHVWYERLESPDVVDYVARIGDSLEGVPIAYEAQSEGRAQLRFLKRDHPHLNVHEIRCGTSKRARALSVASAARTHRLRLPLTASWMREFRRQMDAFTGAGGSVQDDIPDSVGHSWNFALTLAPPMTGLVGGQELGQHWRR